MGVFKGDNWFESPDKDMDWIMNSLYKEIFLNRPKYPLLIVSVKKLGSLLIFVESIFTGIESVFISNFIIRGKYILEPDIFCL